MQNDQTIKADGGKLRINLVPTQIIRDIAEVREYGQKKYGDSESWRRVDVDRYINALLRHTLSFVDNIYGLDDESGIPHYKHMACNLAFLCELLGDNHPVAVPTPNIPIEPYNSIDPTSLGYVYSNPNPKRKSSR